MGKVKINQHVLIKMKSFPFEQFGIITGKVDYISDVAFKENLFIARISFSKIENKNLNQKILLKNGMEADAEIIIEESSLLQRFLRNIIKTLNTN